MCVVFLEGSWVGSSREADVYPPVQWVSALDRCPSPWGNDRHSCPGSPAETLTGRSQDVALSLVVFKAPWMFPASGQG